MNTYDFGAYDDPLNLSSVTGKIIQQLAEAIERNLVAAIECFLGRVPSDEEVKQHAQIFISPDQTRRDFCWDGTLVMTVQFNEPSELGTGGGWTITRYFGDEIKA